MAEPDLHCTAVELSVKTSVRLDFRLHSGVVGTARRFLSEVYGQVLDDPEEAFRVAIVAQELLENLAKYSEGGECAIEVGLRRENGHPFVCIRTFNNASPDQVNRLREIIDRIRDAADPVAHYHELIASSPDREGSGLGLARVSAETRMSLGYRVRGTQVTILAEAPTYRTGTPC